MEIHLSRIKEFYESGASKGIISYTNKTPEFEVDSMTCKKFLNLIRWCYVYRIDRENAQLIIEKFGDSNTNIDLINPNLKYISKNSPYLSDRVFYICSYGRCGSKMLCKYLGNFGLIKHIHSRKPPEFLTYIEDSFPDYEHFGNKRIEDDKLHKYTIIYIYRNPIDVILGHHSKEIT